MFNLRKRNQLFLKNIAVPISQCQWLICATDFKCFNTRIKLGRIRGKTCLPPLPTTLVEYLTGIMPALVIGTGWSAETDSRMHLRTAFNYQKHSRISPSSTTLSTEVLQGYPVVQIGPSVYASHLAYADDI